MAIIGAGFGGLCMGIRLKEAGCDSFEIFDRSAGVGGVWHDNVYPGAGCDIPAHLYSYSFEKYREPGKRFPDQAYTLDYLRRCVDRHGLGPHLRLNTEIARLRFDEPAGQWRLWTTGGDEHVADVVISAVGQLSRPRYPDIPGRDDFAGLSFHSSRWPGDLDVTGRDVAVIGNGSSAAQLIPAIAPRVRRLYAFQRSPTWVLAKSPLEFGRGFSLAFRSLPFTHDLYRSVLSWRAERLLLPALHQGWTARFLRKMAVSHLNKQVPDPELRERLLPDYPIGCKRIVISSDYYPALARDNVEVVTEKIVQVTPEGIQSDGELRTVDTIVYATGFHSTEFLEPLEVIGRDERTLSGQWEKGARAYLGMAAPNFPNLFFMYGPNTNLGHNSIIYVLEAQAGYITACLREMAANGGGTLEARPEALEEWVRLVEAGMGSTVWTADCTNWFKNAAGTVVNNWPYRTARYRKLVRRPQMADFRFTRAPSERTVWVTDR
ncbi:NAD(P)/FAD-dependent oxidoreductase [Actinomadura sp. KC216]|uniref:flavin-containing monooxygenase n=1 Tax=Actinomadura sp. KC216 TaxID=2530370 RepID=UPI001FB6AEF5|nr:NAD(P)/FAD-dependent oxidoreductase [Actinomadura sp. KC216]